MFKNMTILFIGFITYSSYSYSAEKYNKEKSAKSTDLMLQIIEVRKRYPLVAEFYKFTGKLPLFCNVNDDKYIQSYNACLKQNPKPSFDHCREQALRASCEDMVLAPPNAR